MGRRFKLIAAIAAIAAVLGFGALVYRAYAKGKAKPGIPPSAQALVSRHVAWLALPLPQGMDVGDGLDGLSLKLWDTQGNAVDGKEMAVHLARKPDGAGWEYFLLPMGDFAAYPLARAQVELPTLNQKTEFTFRTVPQAKVVADGEGFEVRDVIARGPYVALFVCFHVPDVRDWQPQLSLYRAGTNTPLYLYARQFYHVKQAATQTHRCNLFLFGPNPKGTAKQEGALRGELVLKASGFRLDEGQCLTQAEKERLQQKARQENLNPAMLPFVEWKDAPADWSFRWCPRPPKGAEEDGTLAGQWAQRVQKLYDDLFFVPMRFQAKIHLP